MIAISSGVNFFAIFCYSDYFFTFPEIPHAFIPVARLSRSDSTKLSRYDLGSVGHLANNQSQISFYLTFSKLVFGVPSEMFRYNICMYINLV